MPSTRGLIFIALNVVRGLSLIAIVLVFASNIVIMAKDIKAVNNANAVAIETTSDNSTVTCDYINDSSVPNQAAGPFWAVLNRLLILFQVIVLFLSEVDWPASFFARFFPILGRDFGLGALGIIQALIGAAVLSHHVEDFALVSAFFMFSVGCINMFFGLLFRESAKKRRALGAWAERNDDILSGGGAGLPVHRTGQSSAYPVSFKEYGLRHSQSDDDHNASPKSTAGLGFGRQGEKAAGLKGYMISQPVSSLPKYAPSGSR